MSNAFSGSIKAPILGVLAEELAALLTQAAPLRQLQAANAARALYGIDGQSVAVAGDPLRPGPVSNTVVQAITLAASGTGQTFAQLIIVFDTTSGAGRYRVDGQLPTTAVGFEIPAGGFTLEITGMDNIKNFRMVAQTATTMPYFAGLFI
jgi:hypothetical protein